MPARLSDSGRESWKQSEAGDRTWIPVPEKKAAEAAVACQPKTQSHPIR